MRFFPFLLMLVLLAPGAAAYVNLCERPAGVCVYSWSYDSGAGSCDETTSDRYSYRVLRVSHEESDTRREAEVTNDCSASAREDGETQRSSLRARYSSSNASQGEYSWLWIDWRGTDAPSGSSCGTDVWIYNLDPLPQGSTDLGCPAGRPPFVLRVLP